MKPPNGNTETPNVDVHVYDIENDDWNTLPDIFDLPSTGGKTYTADISAFVLNGKIYIAGGYNGSGSYETSNHVWKFDPNGQTGAEAWVRMADLNQKRGDHATVVVKGKAYAIGGFHDGNNWEAPVADIEVQPGH